MVEAYTSEGTLALFAHTAFDPAAQCWRVALVDGHDHHVFVAACPADGDGAMTDAAADELAGQLWSWFEALPEPAMVLCESWRTGEWIRSLLWRRGQGVVPERLARLVEVAALAGSVPGRAAEALFWAALPKPWSEVSHAQALRASVVAALQARDDGELPLPDVRALKRCGKLLADCISGFRGTWWSNLQRQASAGTAQAPEALTGVFVWLNAPTDPQAPRWQIGLVELRLGFAVEFDIEATPLTAGDAQFKVVEFVHDLLDAQLGNRPALLLCADRATVRSLRRVLTDNGLGDLPRQVLAIASVRDFLRSPPGVAAGEQFWIASGIARRAASALELAHWLRARVLSARQAAKLVAEQFERRDGKYDG